jgi:hypothetical protein
MKANAVIPHSHINASEPKGDFLDEKALESPSLALAQATRQTQLMADQVQAMLAQYWVAETTRNTDLAKTLQRDEDKIDTFNTNRWEGLRTRALPWRCLKAGEPGLRKRWAYLVSSANHRAHHPGA